LETSFLNFTIKDARQFAVKQILENLAFSFEISPEVAFLEVDLLLGEALKVQYAKVISRTDILSLQNEILLQSTSSFFSELLGRRLKGEPIEYILKQKEFYGNNIFVDNRVLIPRSETEMLVSEALKIFTLNQNESFCLLEAGVGSGAVIASIVLELKKLNKLDHIKKISAFDISQDALEVSKINFKLSGLNSLIEVSQNSIFDFKINDYILENQAENYIFLSNPPYLDLRDEMVSLAVKEFEPEIALFSEDLGFAHIESLIQVFADSYDTCLQLKVKANLILEIGYNQGDRVKLLVKKWPYLVCEILKDLSNNDRVVCISFG
jgi:release factor glutamine methyltransferase